MLENTSLFEYFAMVKKRKVPPELQAEIDEILPKDKSRLEIWKSFLQLKILQIAKIYEGKRDLNIEIKLQQRLAQIEKLNDDNTQENTAKSLELWVLFVEQYYKFNVNRHKMMMLEFCVKTTEADKQMRQQLRQINEQKAQQNAG